MENNSLSGIEDVIYDVIMGSVWEKRLVHLVFFFREVVGENDLPPGRFQPHAHQPYPGEIFCNCHGNVIFVHDR